MADRDRILTYTPNGYATDRAAVSSKRQTQAVERVLRESGIKILAAEPAPSRVTARKSVNDAGAWQDCTFIKCRAAEGLLVGAVHDAASDRTPLARVLPRVIGGPASRHGCFRRKLPPTLTSLIRRL